VRRPDTDLDGPITLKEMTNAWERISTAKLLERPVPIDVDRRISSPSYLDAVLKMLNAILTTGDVPQEWKDVVITILYKSDDPQLQQLPRNRPNKATSAKPSSAS
jgi:hypothetical protein